MANNKARLEANRLKIPSLTDMTDSLVNDQTEVVEHQIMVPDPNAIVPKADGTMVFKRFTLTPVGMIIPADATADELTEIGLIVGRLQSSTQWLLGDWLNSAASDRIWGDGTYDRYAAAYNLKSKTLRDYAYVSRQVDLSIRIDKLSFAHHQLVAALDTIDQITWLNRALSENLSVSQMRHAMLKNPPAPPPLSKQFMRDFNKYRLQLATMGEGNRQELRGILVDLVARIDQLERRAKN